MTQPRFVKKSHEAVEEERSICGFRRRLFWHGEDVPTGITHLKTEDATPHWHRRTHEYYFVIRGSGKLVIDGEDVPVAAGDCVYIRPGAVHHAVGDLESLVIATPPYTPDDVITTPPGETAP